MFLFQCHQTLSRQHLTQLVPLIVATLAHPGPNLADLPPSLHPLHVELRAAQTKTCAFLMFLAKNLPNIFEPHAQTVTDSLLMLLRTCPDNVNIRKELLVAIRNM